MVTHQHTEEGTPFGSRWRVRTVSGSTAWAPLRFLIFVFFHVSFLLPKPRLVLARPSAAFRGDGRRRQRAVQVPLVPPAPVTPPRRAVCHEPSTTSPASPPHSCGDDGELLVSLSRGLPEQNDHRRDHSIVNCHKTTTTAAVDAWSMRLPLPSTKHGARQHPHGETHKNANGRRIGRAATGRKYRSRRTCYRGVCSVLQRVIQGKRRCQSHQAPSACVWSSDRRAVGVTKNPPPGISRV